MPASLAVFDRASALEFLFSRINYERTTQIPYRTGGLKLARMQQLLALLGDPQANLPIVHIAGTKGKGSTATMIAGILQAAGYKTGLYTSPHLERLEERFLVNGRTCTNEEFVRLAADLEVATNQLEARDPQNRCPTFFEITTAMGLLHFARSGAEAVVLEVGLGGRLDSTNVCQPKLCVITSISFDHTKQLGNTLAAIAREKAGIIKLGIPVVCGVLEAEPQQAIAEIAAQQQAPLIQRGREFDYSVQFPATAQTLQVNYHEPAREPRYELGPVTLGMIGSHQAQNAATAIAAVRLLQQQGFNISETAIAQGLATAKCPARIEVVRERPTVILDVAHNLASIAALIETLDERFTARRRVLVFSSSRDKNPAGMLQLLLPNFDQVILTKYVNNPRAVEPQELHALATNILSAANPRKAELHLAAEPTTAWTRAQALAGPADLICITGSFFLAAELRSQFT